VLSAKVRAPLTARVQVCPFVTGVGLTTESAGVSTVTALAVNVAKTSAGLVQGTHRATSVSSVIAHSPSCRAQRCAAAVTAQLSCSWPWSVARYGQRLVRSTSIGTVPRCLDAELPASRDRTPL
jgi:hypothetical protein